MVDDEDAAEAMFLLLERCKLVVEGAGAVGVAALLGGQVAPAEHGTTVAILDGERRSRPAAVDRAPARDAGGTAARRSQPRARPPGELAGLLTCVAEAGAQRRRRLARARGLRPACARDRGRAPVLETRGREHADRVLRAMRAAGYPAGRLDDRSVRPAGMRQAVRPSVRTAPVNRGRSPQRASDPKVGHCAHPPKTSLERADHVPHRHPDHQEQPHRPPLIRPPGRARDSCAPGAGGLGLVGAAAQPRHAGRRADRRPGARPGLREPRLPAPTRTVRSAGHTRPAARSAAGSATGGLAPEPTPTARPVHRAVLLDEATAFAAGHRPCALCRRADYRRFLAGGGFAGADDADVRLHAERLDGRARRTHRVRHAELPDGAFVLEDDGPWLVSGDALLRWTPAGNGPRGAAGWRRNAAHAADPDPAARRRMARGPAAAPERGTNMTPASSLAVDSVTVPLEDLDYDWLVVGSGFGGSVSALRLAEKGYRVGLHRGRPGGSPTTTCRARRGTSSATSGRRSSACGASSG